MTRGLIALAMLLPALAACATRPAPHAVVEVPATQSGPAWTRIAGADDQVLIAGLSQRLAQSRAALPKRYLAKAKAEGALLDSAAAEALPQLPPGPYHCRLVRFGGRARFATFAPDLCWVEPSTDRLAFTKQTGSNLPEGYVFPDSDTRQVFLGTLRTAGEKGGKAYGDNPVSDLVGVVERVAPFRWRLILAKAGRGAALDLYELVPVPPAVPGAAPAFAAKS